MGQVDLAEEKSAGIVVDETSCLRAVRGDGAALLLHRLMIDADPETASDWINLSRGWERMSPDDILEQSDFFDATLNLTCDPVGRLVVAMGIVSPANSTAAAMALYGTGRNGSECAAMTVGEVLAGLSLVQIGNRHITKPCRPLDRIRSHERVQPD